MKRRIVCVVTGYNCEKYAFRCVSSILTQQSIGEVLVISIDDGSKDRTSIELNRYVDERHKVISHTENKGAAFRRWEVFQSGILKPNDIVVLVGMDDELLSNALYRIEQEYDCGKWMTYGNWVNQHGVGLPRGFELYFNSITHHDRDYRKRIYRSTAPNTFLAFLLDYFTEDDFKINGEWVQTCTETNLMFGLLELCGEHRIGVIQQPIYMYNEKLPSGSINRFGREEKHRILGVFQDREKKELILNSVYEKSK